MGFKELFKEFFTSKPYDERLVKERTKDYTIIISKATPPKYYVENSKTKSKRND